MLSVTCTAPSDSSPSLPTTSYTGSNALEPPSGSGGVCSACSGPGVTGPSAPGVVGPTGIPSGGYSGASSGAGSYAGPTGAGAFPSFPSFPQGPYGTYGTPFSAPAPGMGLFPSGYGGGSYGGGSSGPASAMASATIGPQGGYGQAQVFHYVPLYLLLAWIHIGRASLSTRALWYFQIGDKDHPELGQRQGGPFAAPGEAGSFGTFSSVSTGSSTVNGKTTSYKEAISGVNDNGKITTFVARDPPK